jgi:cytochrome c-type biogenesis protein CcmF
MYLLGTTLLVAGMALSLLACGAYILVIRGNHAALSYARGGVYGTMAAMALVWATLVIMFATRRFDFAYVNNYSSSDLDAFFTIAAIWAGQSGSFAIWTLLTAIVAALLVGRARHFEPYALTVISFSVAVLIGFTLILNPFAPNFDEVTGMVLRPPDGRGLNPLLHNFWMIIHPPVLFVGFALAIVPFALAIGGLLRRDYDTWVVRALPWTLAAWAFLGLALLLGGYWAYETLGWGGYWGWDPVENSSLVPWLLLTALLHGMLVQRSHGSLRRTNFTLALLSFIAVFYSTFLTRSGVLENFSVHTFVEEGIYGVMLAFMLTLVVGSVVALGMRWRDIPARPLSDKFFSRDNFFVLAILTLGILSLVVILGTSMPVISSIPGVGHTLQDALGAVFELDDGTQFGGEPLTDGRFNVATSFYDITTPPLALVAVVLLILGPLLGWRDTNMRNLLMALRIPALVAVVATCVALVVGVRDPLPLAYVGLSVFALGTNILMITRTLKGGWLRIGGYLAHVGVALLMIGVVGSRAYATPDERLSFETGDTVTFQNYEITFNEWRQTDESDGVLDLTVRRGNEEFRAQPELYMDESMGSTIQNPSIKSYIWQDLYIAPADYVPEVDPARPVMGVGATNVVGPYEITFEGFDIDSDAMTQGTMAEMGTNLTVLYEGEETTVTPRLRVEQNPDGGDAIFTDMPATLPGGETISLITFDLGRRLILLQAQGGVLDDLPVQPARAVITVSTKPGVVLVWIGMIVSVIGGFIAVLRRYLEGQARLSGQPARLPRGVPGLAGLSGLPRKLGWRGGSAAR